MRGEGVIDDTESGKLEVVSDWMINGMIESLILHSLNSMKTDRKKTRYSLYQQWRNVSG